MEGPRFRPAGAGGVPLETRASEGPNLWWPLAEARKCPLNPPYSCLSRQVGVPTRLGLVRLPQPEPAEPNQRMGVVDDLALAIMEYQKLRDESLQAMQAQQSTLQWSMATFGAIIGAIALLINQRALALQPIATFVALGVALPTFVMCCGLSWVGELLRMERIGVYLRGLELEIARIALERGPRGNHSAYPAYVLTPQWETFIASSSQRTEGLTKQRTGYIGSIGIYILALLTCLSACVWLQWLAHHTSAIQKITFTLLCIIELVVDFTIGFRLGRKLAQASRAAVNIDALNASIRRSLSTEPPVEVAQPPPHKSRPDNR
jgi:hypothetical protein